MQNTCTNGYSTRGIMSSSIENNELKIYPTLSKCLDSSRNLIRPTSIRLLTVSSNTTGTESLLSTILPSFVTLRSNLKSRKIFAALQTTQFLIANKSFNTLSISWVTESSYIKLSTDDTRVFSSAKATTSCISFGANMSSINGQRTTKFPTVTFTPDRNWLVPVLIPVVLVIAIGTIIMLAYICKRKNRRTRAHKWNSDVENSLSWFEAFELPQTVGNTNIMSDVNEPVDFSIPMGPLCMNNFAYENYDSTTEDSMMEHFSTKNKQKREFHHTRHCSDVHPKDSVLTSNLNSDKPNGNQALKGAHFITNVEKETSKRHMRVMNSF